MADREARYNMKEISTASGIKVNTLQSRRKRLGIPANERGYTLDEVKRMIKKPRERRQYNEAHAAALRKQLLDDGAL